MRSTALRVLAVLACVTVVMAAVIQADHPFGTSLTRRSADSCLDEDSPALQLSFLKSPNLNTTISVYVTGFDEAGQLKVLSSSGCWVYPVAQSRTTPTPLNGELCINIADTSRANLRLPRPLSSGRIWIAQGTFHLSIVLAPDGTTRLVQPSPAENFKENPWSTVELTYDQAASLWMNLSFVDFIGITLRLMLLNDDGSTQHAYGLAPGAKIDICEALTNQSRIDGQPWDELCLYDRQQRPVQIVSPNTLISTKTNAFAGYWTSYVDAVWKKYAENPLVIDTQSIGTVSCAVRQGSLTCQNESFTQPSTADIFSCSSGPFASTTSDTILRRNIVARLCAAFNRSTLLQTGGNIQPGLNSSAFYASEPTNFYSKLIHEHEVQKLGYAFPYDDVSTREEVNQANLLTSSTAQTLSILIGDF